jgi:hypothetical protein
MLPPVSGCASRNEIALRHDIPRFPCLSPKKVLPRYGIRDIYVMPYTLMWSPVDQVQIQAEFMKLLNDPNPTVGNDAAQLVLGLRRLVQQTNSTPAGGPQVYSYVYPSCGLCAAYYAYESNNGPRIYVVGFCLTADMLKFWQTAKNRLRNVP